MSKCIPSGLSRPPLAVLVYDITSQPSFDALAQKWLPQAKASQNSQNRACMGVVIGAKADLAHRRAVSEHVAKKWAVDNRLLYAECSAVSIARCVDCRLEGQHECAASVQTAGRRVDEDERRRVEFVKSRRMLFCVQTRVA